MKHLLLLLFALTISAPAAATQVDRCRIEGSITDVVSREQHDGYWSLVFDVSVQDVSGADTTSTEWCKATLASRLTPEGTLRVSTGDRADEPSIPDSQPRWYVWSFVDAGEVGGEGFWPEVSPPVAEAESWQFVYVVRSTGLEVFEGVASLTRSGPTLSGPLRDDRTGEYRIELTIDGARVEGWFGAVESDDGGTRLAGSLHQWRVPGGECWQTIQLTDGSSSISLARNVPQCDARK